MRWEGGEGSTKQQRGDKSPGGKRRGFWKSAVICSGEKSRLSPLPGGSPSSGQGPPIPGAARGRDPAAAAAEGQGARPGPADGPAPRRRGRRAPAGLPRRPSAAPWGIFRLGPSIPPYEQVTACPKPSLLGNSRQQDQGRKQGRSAQAREGTQAQIAVSEHGFPGFRLAPAACAVTHRTLLSPRHHEASGVPSCWQQLLPPR